MPKFLKYMFNFFAFITGLFVIFIIIIPDFLIRFLFNGLLRIPAMLAECVFLRPYLVSKHIKKEIFKINMYALFSLTPLTFLVLFLQALFATSIEGQMPIFWVHCIGIVMTVLIVFCEVYIQMDFIKERNLATNFLEVKKRLYCIFIPFWILFYIFVAILFPWIVDTFFVGNKVDPNVEYITFK